MELKKGITNVGIPADVINLLDDTSRDGANRLMTAVGYVDLLIPRGGAGGYTLIRPDEESETYSRLYILDRITMSLGGRAAEKLVLTLFAPKNPKYSKSFEKTIIPKYEPSQRR